MGLVVFNGLMDLVFSLFCIIWDGGRVCVLKSDKAGLLEEKILVPQF